MANKTIAERIADMNQRPDQYCEFVADNAPEIQLDLADSGVTVVDQDDFLLVLDQYAVGKEWFVEVWGPFFQESVFPKMVLAKNLKKSVSHFPAQINFFYGLANTALTDWLENHQAALTRQTIWQVCPVAMRPSGLRFEAYESPLPKKKAEEVLSLHHQMFHDDAVANISSEHPLFLAYQGTQLCGYALVEIEETLARLLFVAVAPAFRQQSIATNLIAFLWQSLHMSDSGKTMTLVQSEKAEAAGFLYEHLGFKKLRVLQSAVMTMASAN
ncbi:MAG: GNAT family N-acetyltransferase [Oenococcus sp.]|uniref:GNAT family N-acetyltransferase n=1 Tax=Oenococcus sp. TaxID=1979414 RepID=UPI0039EA6962